MVSRHKIFFQREKKHRKGTTRLYSYCAQISLVFKSLRLFTLTFWRNTICMFKQCSQYLIRCVNVHVDYKKCLLCLIFDFCSDLYKAKYVYKWGPLLRIHLSNMIQTTHTHYYYYHCSTDTSPNTLYTTQRKRTSLSSFLNSPYSIFEHPLPQCTAHYQGDRSKNPHTCDLNSPSSWEDAFYVEMG